MNGERKRPFRLKEAEVRLYVREKDGWFSDEPVNTPRAAVKLMSAVLSGLDREVVCAVNLDTKLRPLNCSIISIGAIDRSIVPVQNIFKSAILSNAAGVILLHNHPSGDTSPSRQDTALTSKAVLAGWLMDVPLRDHIITGIKEGDMYSFMENMPDMFRCPRDETLQQMAEELIGQQENAEEMTVQDDRKRRTDHERETDPGRTGNDNTDKRRGRYI